jgi:Flp pilus assembly protein TadB
MSFKFTAALAGSAVILAGLAGLLVQTPILAVGAVVAAAFATAASYVANDASSKKVRTFNTHLSCSWLELLRGNESQIPEVGEC